MADELYEKSLRQLRDFVWSYEASCGMSSTFDAMVQVMLLGGPQNTGVNSNDINLKNLQRFETARQAYLGLLPSQQRVIDLVCHERPDQVPLQMREAFVFEHGGLTWDLYFLARHQALDVVSVTRSLSEKQKAALMKSLKVQAQEGFVEALGAYSDIYHALTLEKTSHGMHAMVTEGHFSACTETRARAK